MSELVPAVHQLRSRRTRERILDAAYELLLEGGPEALTVGALADRAGVGVGSVYRRFGGKDRLLLVVQATFAESVRDEVTKRLDPTLAPPASEPRRLVTHAVEAIIDVIRPNAKLLGVFLRLGAGSREVHDIGFRAVTQSQGSFATLLDEIDVVHDDPGQAIAFAFQIVDSYISYQLLHARGDEADQIDWDHIAPQLARLVTNYLLI